MTPKYRAALLIALVLPLIAGCATTGSRPADSDPGYFLTMRQKGQLIGKGQIQDSAGRWYDVWIVPGYVQPARRVRTYVRKTGSDLAEYGRPDKYRSIAKHSKNAFEWAFDDCLVDFVFDGVPRCWGENFSEARARTGRRVFGWWFAYPWALLESSVESVARVAFGGAGAVLGTAWGVAVVPGYYTVNSAAKGAWHLGVDAILFPAIGFTWNTAIAPPLALVGQKPSPSRVDGFWVTQLTQAQVEQAAVRNEPPANVELDAMAEWGRILLKETEPYEQRRKDLRSKTQAKIQELRQEESSAMQALTSEEERHIATLPAPPAGVVPIDMRRMREVWPDLRETLKGAGGLTPDEMNRIRALLVQYSRQAALPPSDPLRPKTDPVQRSIEVIGDAE